MPVSMTRNVTRPYLVLSEAMAVSTMHMVSVEPCFRYQLIQQELFNFSEFCLNRLMKKEGISYLEYFCIEVYGKVLVVRKKCTPVVIAYY